MVMRYYGSKEKLFAAAASFDLQLPDLTELPEPQYGQILVRHFLNRWESDGTFLALLRAAVTNEAARERMNDILTTQITPLVATVCPDPAEAPVRAALIASHMLGFALCRYVLRLPSVPDMATDDVVEWVAPVLQRYLTGGNVSSRSDSIATATGSPT